MQESWQVRAGGSQTKRYNLANIPKALLAASLCTAVGHRCHNPVIVVYNNCTFKTGYQERYKNTIRGLSSAFCRWSVYLFTWMIFAENMEFLFLTFDCSVYFANIGFPLLILLLFIANVCLLFGKIMYVMLVVVRA